MPLVEKGVSSATAEASRANGRKSRGPTTERGKSISRTNAIKHWGRAEAIRDLLPALGEDPREFEAVRRDLYDSLAPGDGFERLLVDDMAEIHWRLRRMIRAEAAKQAESRREAKARAEAKDANLEVGRFHDLEPFVAAKLGFAGLDDSPPKFLRVIQFLKAIGSQVEEEGFPSQGLAHLRTVYGKNPSWPGHTLMGVYEHGCEEESSADEATRQLNRRMFLRELQAEIAWFEERAASDRQARAELRAPRAASGLLPSKLDISKVIYYHDRLECAFVKKYKLLMKHRARRIAALRSQPDDQSSVAGAPEESAQPA